MVDDEPESGTILIVEDHQDTRETLRDYLEEFGYIVDIAVDGADGLRKVQARPVDLVITDLNMPHVSGLELLAAIKSHKLTPDVLVLSATGLISKAVEAMRLGAVNYLVKPVDLDQLTSEVRAVMRVRRHREVQRSAAQTTMMIDPGGEPTRPQMAYDLETGLPLPLSGEPAAAEGETPPTIGRYQVLSELGTGGMGTVYKCFDPALRRTVAVKVVATGTIRRVHRELLLQRFAREAQAAGMLNHPNIVTVYDYHADPRSHSVYLAMEYVAGQSLGAIITGAGKLPWERTTGLAFQIADALEFAHRNQIVHRDVKPENVLVADGDVAKILDFASPSWPTRAHAPRHLRRLAALPGPRELPRRRHRLPRRPSSRSARCCSRCSRVKRLFRFEGLLRGVHRILFRGAAAAGELRRGRSAAVAGDRASPASKGPDKRYIDEMEPAARPRRAGPQMAGLKLQLISPDPRTRLAADAAGRVLARRAPRSIARAAANAVASTR